MGSFRTGLGLAVILWLSGLQSLVSGVLDYWGDPEHLHCRAHHMQLLLPSLLDDAAFSLTVIDDIGKSHYLHNNSDCGTWIELDDNNGSVVVGASYDGCFMREEDGYFVMTIVLQEVLRNKKLHYHKKDLKCPILPAMDAPSNSDCAAINRVDRIPCGNASVSRDLCQSIDCCYNPSDQVTPCYFGNRITAQCNDGNIVVVLSKDLTLPSLMLQSVKVVDVDVTSCPELNIQRTPTFVGFKFPLSCSPVVRGIEGGIAYENTFFADKEIRTWQGSSITRDSTMRVTVRCTFSQTGVVPVQVEVNTLPPPPPVSTTGPLMLEMRIAPDGQYTSYYADKDYPVTYVLRDPVFLEVRILQRTDPNLVLLLELVAQQSFINPTDAPQWPVLFNGCPFTGDNYLTQLSSVGSQSIAFSSHYKRFIVSTFAFVDQNTNVALDGLVFFHCSASVCVQSATQSCRVDCAPRRRRMADVVPGESVTVTSEGPVIFNANKAFPSQELTEVEEGDLGSATSRSWLIGAAAVGCVLAVILITLNLFKRQPMSTVIA